MPWPQGGGYYGPPRADSFSPGWRPPPGQQPYPPVRCTLASQLCTNSTYAVRRHSGKRRWQLAILEYASRYKSRLGFAGRHKRVLCCFLAAWRPAANASIAAAAAGADKNRHDPQLRESEENHAAASAAAGRPAEAAHHVCLRQLGALRVRVSPSEGLAGVVHPPHPVSAAICAQLDGLFRLLMDLLPCIR